MKIEDIKRTLRNYRKTKNSLELELRLEREIREAAYEVRAVSNDGMPRTPGIKEPVLETVIGLEKAADAVADAADRHLKTLNLCQCLLSYVTDEFQLDILRMHFYSGMTFDELSTTLHACRQTIFNHYNAALKTIEEATESPTSADGLLDDNDPEYSYIDIFPDEDEMTA